MSHVLHRATLWALRILAGLLVLLLGVLMALRSAPGRRTLLGMVMPMVNRALAGHIKFSSVEGDLTHSIIIHDLKIDDAEGVQALYARRIEAHYRLEALWQRTVQIDELDVDGAQLLIRHLKDNRVNFAALAPRSSAPPGAPADPPKISIRHLHLRFDGGYDPPVGHEGNQLARPRGSFDIEGALEAHGADVTLRVDHLISDARDPLAAHVELSGGLKVDPPQGPNGHVEITFRDIKLTCAAEGRELERLNPALRAKGRWKVSVNGAGPMSGAGLWAHVVVEPPAGSLVADGTFARTWPGLKWTARASAAGLDPGLDWRGLQPGSVDLQMAAHAAAGAGEIEVRQFDASSGQLRAQLRGQSDFAGNATGEATASAGNLSRLAALGLPGLAGSARLAGHLTRRGGHNLFDGELHGRALRLPGAAVQSVDGQVRAADWQGSAELAARGIRAGPVSLSALSIASESNGRRLRSRVNLRRDDDATLLVELDATPRREAQAGRDDSIAARLSGVDLIIGRLVASRRDDRFTLPVPAQLHLFGSAEAPSLDGTVAGIAVRVRGRKTSDAFSLDLGAEAPDLSSLGSPRLAGRLRATAHVVSGAQLLVDGQVHGQDLRLAGARLNRLDARVHSAATSSSVHLTIDRLAAPGIRLDTLVLDGTRDGERLALALAGKGPAKSALALLVDGHYAPKQSNLTVRELTVDAAGQSWRLDRPAPIRVDSLVTVHRLAMSSLGQTLALEGKLRRSSGALDVTLAAHDLQPANFAKLIGVKEALSDASVGGSVHLGGTLRTPLLTASLKAASGKNVAWYGLSFNALSLEASAGRQSVVVRLDAWGAGSGRMALQLHAAPLHNLADGNALVGVEATIDRLQLSANDHVWQIGAPCRLLFDSAVTVDHCSLVGGTEQILFTGRVPFREGAMDATLTTHALDLRKLGAFLAPGHKEPPTTSFNARVHAGGTRQAPLVDLELRGIGSQVDEGLPENVDYRVRAHYGDGRVDGEVSARQLGTKLGIGARFNLPISFAQSDDKPIAFELEARPVPFFKLRDSLPTALAGLRGFFSLRVRASGTTRHPIFSAELHAPSWDLDDLTNNDTIVNLSYDGALLRVNSVTSFAATTFAASLFGVLPRRNSGTIKLELKTPVDLGSLLSRPREILSTLQHTAQLSASAEIKGVQLASVPLQVIGIATPFTVGLIEGALSLSGTLDAPSAHARLRATGLSKPGVVDQVDLDTTLAFDRNLLQVNGRLDLRKHPLLVVKGEADLDAKRLFDGERWAEGALRGEISVQPFDLAALRGMQPRLTRLAGRLSGTGAVRGSFAHPEWLLDLGATGLELGGDGFDQAHAKFRFQERRFRLSGAARQSRGGSLSGEADWSRAAGDPLALSVTAQQLDIGFLASASEEIHSLTGALDAKLTVGGTRAAPRPEGFLRVRNARLALRGKTGDYHNLGLDVRMGDGRAGITLDAETAEGSLRVSGEARVDGVQPTRLQLSAQARNFALVYGSFAAKLDADLGLAGDRDSGQWTGRVDLLRGTINLPDLPGAGPVQPLGELSDVSFGDQRVERVAEGKGVRLAARIIGPLALRGHEVNLDLDSDLALTVAPGQTTVNGTVTGKDGTVELFGRQYRLESAQLGFAGPANDPSIQLRATRRSGRSTLIVTVSGTARNPEVALTSDPPLYDDPQLALLMLAGSTRTSAEPISFRSLQRQLGGILSSLILSKIKEQMAAQLPTESFEPADEKTASRFTLSPLEVGRYLSDRVYISYEHQFGASIGRSAANANESQIKVSLPHNGEVDTSVGDGGVAGVYVYWTYRY